MKPNKTTLWIINQFANTPSFPGHTRQYEIASYLVKKNIEVKVFTSDFNLSERCYKKNKLWQLKVFEIIDGIKWTWLKVTPYKKNNWLRYINMLSFCLHFFIYLLIKGIFNNLLNRSPKVIIVSSPQLLSAYFTLILSKLLFIPFIVEIRDLWPQVLIDQGGKNENSFIIKILSWMEKKVYESANKVIVLSKGSISYVQDRGAKDVTWIPNGPDLEKFIYSELPSEPLHFSTKRMFTFIYAGAHGEANDLKTVIEAARYLEDYPIKFIFAGDGQLKNDLIERAKRLKKVEFISPIPSKDIPSFLAKADAIIVSLKDVPLFRYGVSPNKLYDAYAIGRPVITTIPGIINKEVEENKLGYTSNAGDPLMLSKAIKKLFTTPREERVEMGKRGRALAEKIYSRQRANKSYLDLLHDIF